MNELYVRRGDEPALHRRANAGDEDAQIAWRRSTPNEVTFTCCANARAMAIGKHFECW